MSSPNKRLNNDIQHHLRSTPTQSLTYRPTDHHDASQDHKKSSYNSDPSLDQHQRNRDLERQSSPRSSFSSPLYQHTRSRSDGKHKNSAQIQKQTLQHSFEDLDHLQQQQQQQQGGGDAASSPFSNHSTTQRHPPLTPSPASSHLIHPSDISHSSDQHLLSDTDEDFSSLAPPYAECPLVTDDLHLPVPTIIHQFFIYDNDNSNDEDEFGNRKHSTDSNKTFDTLVNQLCPYPFRSRAPLGDRLKRKPPQQIYDDTDTAKRYPSILAQQRDKRHSLGNGQIDRLVYGRKGLLEDHEISDLLFDPHQHRQSTEAPDSSSSSPPSSPSPLPSPLPPLPAQHHHRHEHQPDDLLLEDRIHWLTQGYYLIPTTTSQQNHSRTPSPPGGHDPPPSLFSPPPSSSSSPSSSSCSLV